MDKYSVSIDTIENNQTACGSYIASPNFSQYAYCWLRDGAFIAHAMARAGRVESSNRFFDWAFEVLERYSRRLELPVSAADPQLSEFMPTRYTLEGFISEDDWPNAQSDGYGTLLWSLASQNKPLNSGEARLCELCVRYLERVWKIPCYDVWEEFPEGIHTSTLLSIAAGLKAAEVLLNRETAWREVMGFVVEKLTDGGRLKKSSLNDSVDSSLIWSAYPFGLIRESDPLWRRTKEKILTDLNFNGGLKRYAGDTYFGGGSWILLSANLASCLFQSGEREEALKIKCWLDGQFDAAGNLPEQVPENLLREDMYSPWVRKWGRIASPLLWSHAAYIELCLDLREADFCRSV